MALAPATAEPGIGGQQHCRGDSEPNPRHSDDQPNQPTVLHHPVLGGAPMGVKREANFLRNFLLHPG